MADPTLSLTPVHHHLDLSPQNQGGVHTSHSPPPPPPPPPTVGAGVGAARTTTTTTHTQPAQKKNEDFPFTYDALPPSPIRRNIEQQPPPPATNNTTANTRKRRNKGRKHGGMDKDSSEDEYRSDEDDEEDEEEDEEEDGDERMDGEETNSTKEKAQTGNTAIHHPSLQQPISLPQQPTPALLTQPPPPKDPLHRTGYVYDQRMTMHKNIEDATHPETPFRIVEIFKRLQEDGFLERMKQIKIREITKEEAMAFHQEEMWDSLTHLDSMSKEELLDAAAQYDSIYLHEETFAAAKLSAGGVMELVMAVWKGEVQNGFAIVRPPGHHAEADEPMGFCVFNNCVIAAHALRTNCGAKRVCILDWDIHHGNGIQRAFLNDPTVLYISLHRYEDATFYPHSDDASMYVVGDGNGVGKTVNIPWPCGQMGDAEYIHAFHRVVLPILQDYQPEMIIVAAGFDAAKGDPLGGGLVTPSGFFHLTHMLKRFANGKIVLALEGGYHLPVIPVCAAACVRALLDDIPPPITNDAPRKEAIDTIDKVCMVQGNHWSSIIGGGSSQSQMNKFGRVYYSLKDMMKKFRSDLLASKYQMHEPKMSWRSGVQFDGEVTVSQSIFTCKTKIMLIHESSRMRYITNSLSQNFLDEDETFIADPILKYIESIHKKGYGLLDVNVRSKHNGLKSADGGNKKALLDAVLDLYDTFLKSNSHIYIITFGPLAHWSLINLIDRREVESTVHHVFSCPCPFDQILPSISTNNPKKVKWFGQHSHIVQRTMDFDAGVLLEQPGIGAECGVVVSAGSMHFTLEELMVAVHDDILDFIGADIVARPAAIISRGK